MPQTEGEGFFRQLQPDSTGHASGQWQDDHFLQIGNDPFSHHNGYGIANVRIGWYSPEGEFSIEAFAENLGDEEYLTYQNTLGGDWGYGVRGKPRTTGVRFIWTM